MQLPYKDLDHDLTHATVVCGYRWHEGKPPFYSTLTSWEISASFNNSLDRWRIEICTHLPETFYLVCDYQMKRSHLPPLSWFLQSGYHLPYVARDRGKFLGWDIFHASTRILLRTLGQLVGHVTSNLICLWTVTGAWVFCSLDSLSVLSCLNRRQMWWGKQ